MERINTQRSSLGFIDAVDSYFKPMVRQFEFSLLEQDPYVIAFGSKNAKLTICHDRLSYEIEVFLRRDGQTISLHDLLAVRVPKGKEERLFFQASTKPAVQACVQQIARLLEKYGAALLTGSPSEWRYVLERKRKEDARQTKELIQNSIRSAAEDAWQRRDFSKVRELYEKMSDSLTQTEQKRLDYARRH